MDISAEWPPNWGQINEDAREMYSSISHWISQVCQTGEVDSFKDEGQCRGEYDRTQYKRYSAIQLLAGQKLRLVVSMHMAFWRSS
jgi:hypothetical protein